MIGRKKNRLFKGRSKFVQRRLTITAIVSLVIIALTIHLSRRSRSVSEWITVDLSPVSSYQLKVGSQHGQLDLSLSAVPKLDILPAARNRFRYERIELGPGAMGSVQNRVLGRGIRLPWMGILVAEIGLAIVMLLWFDRCRTKCRKRKTSRI
ncbi:MAG: hypothetical protein KC931_26875 [Candidatus Omnitrophica bacterium]|nr:hypothetical protein [Candidatus Omnitrophota bacterium]